MYRTLLLATFFEKTYQVWKEREILWEKYYPLNK